MTETLIFKNVNEEVSVKLASQDVLLVKVEEENILTVIESRNDVILAVDETSNN